MVKKTTVATFSKRSNDRFGSNRKPYSHIACFTHPFSVIGLWFGNHRYKEISPITRNAAYYSPYGLTSYISIYSAHSGSFPT